MIKFYNVSKFYKPDIVAVNRINLHLRPKEFVSIVGKSGTGKTTLIKMLMVEESPSRGKIVIGDWDITNIKNSEVPILRRQIGVIFQDFKLLPKKTVFENVSFALEVCGQKRSKVSSIIPQLLKIVGLEEKKDRYPQQLSAGEQQRAAIARALAHQPKILLADEPTGNLDSINAREIIDLLVEINKFGTTVLLVTHNRDIVNSLNKRVITIDNGVIINDVEKGRYML